MSDGRLALVLHTHMPYVEGFGTWPFGEEWLWEAVASCYLPLLDVLGDSSPLTLSVTPVLADQLAAPGAIERCRRFLGDLRARSHALDAEAATDPAVAAELERASGDYARAAAALGDDLGERICAAAAWTSSATHAVLPLIATDAGLALQLDTAVAAQRMRAARPWGGGLWLPECAYAPWLDAALARAGVRVACVDVTDVLGSGDRGHLRPLQTLAGPLLAPIDRELIDLVWSPRGYPAAPAYRDSHALTAHHHRPWSNDGAVYDRARALEQADADARDFLAHAARRLRDGGLAVVAFDTELLGDWWYEGPVWLAAVLERAPAAGVELCALDDAVIGLAPAQLPAGARRATSWGSPRDLSTWSSGAAAPLAWAARRAELDVLAAGAQAGPRALRELLALQSSDWAFMVTRATAGDYPRERFGAHLAALRAALADPEAEPWLRSLAPCLAVGAIAA